MERLQAEKADAYLPSVHDDGNGLLRPPGEAANRPVQRSEAGNCYAFLRGQCRFGDKCKFSHGDSYEEMERLAKAAGAHHPKTWTAVTAAAAGGAPGAPPPMVPPPPPPPSRPY